MLSNERTNEVDAYLYRNFDKCGSGKLYMEAKVLQQTELEANSKAINFIRS